MIITNMKNVCFFVFFSIYCGGKLYSQNDFREPSVNIGNTEFICKKSSGSYHVYDAANDTTPFRWEEGVELLNIKLKSQREFHAVFYDVFSPERLKELTESDVTLRVLFFINKEGVLYQTNYSIPFDAKIKPSELVKLDSLMKQRFRFTTDEFYKKQYDKLFFSQPIRYSKIVNGEKIRPLDEWEYP